MSKDIEYSEKYLDDHFEFRHVILPKTLKSQIPRKRLMSEDEWRALGVTQSRGWMHYMIHAPEPHILLFRRPINTDPRTGKAPSDWNMPDNLTEDEKRFWLVDYPRNYQKCSKTKPRVKGSGQSVMSSIANKENVHF